MNAANFALLPGKGRAWATGGVAQANATVLLDSGWICAQIAAALLIDDGT